MICSWRFLAAVSLFGFPAGCTHTGEKPADPLPGADGGPLPVELREAEPVLARPDFQKALELSDSVRVGMPQRVVEAMFGPPDKAGYKIYGRATQAAWRALVWEWVFQDVKPPRALSIVFQEDGEGTWRVNHGDWPE